MTYEQNTMKLKLISSRRYIESSHANMCPSNRLCHSNQFQTYSQVCVNKSDWNLSSHSQDGQINLESASNQLKSRKGTGWLSDTTRIQLNSRRKYKVYSLHCIPSELVKLLTYKDIQSNNYPKLILNIISSVLISFTVLYVK